MALIMSLARSIVAAGVLLTVPVVLSAPGIPIAAQNDLTASGAVEITSDSREYCLHLLDRVSHLVTVSTSPVPSEVTMLTSEGERLCDHGQPKGGILRLRRALMMMEQGNSARVR